MGIARGFEDERLDIDGAIGGAIDGAGEPDVDEGGVGDAMFELGGDERRMHVRAYNHWVSLLRGRPYPEIGDLDPAHIDFGPHSVLIDFTGGIDDPTIAFLGERLRRECGLESDIVRIADVPGRSLLSRLTDHYLQIIANRAPIGFEAEFVGIRGRTTLYRGILMPFSSDGEAIDFIYGVINWKEMVDDATQATLDAELDAAVRAAPRVPVATPIWADGPSSGLEMVHLPPAPFAPFPDDATTARAGAMAAWRTWPAIGTVAIGAEADEFVVLLARARADGTLDVIKRVAGNDAIDGIARLPDA
ncbi:PAS domain-containing protein [Sphingomonas taxi]|uniref:PAS domain-containing protein n=1 Tax=Sphingomonas taxi TaxID=1549858 RepID=UPI000B013F93